MYEEDDDDSNNSNEDRGLGYNGKKQKKMTKNQEIYGDFQEAYEPALNYQSSSKNKYSYEQFKVGSTIERYASDVQVFLPQKKKDNKKVNKTQEEEIDEKPMLGRFSLNSFLNSLNEKGLEQVGQQDNQDSSQQIPQGLNEKILAKMQLYKIGQEDYEQENPNKRLEYMSYDDYLKISRPSKFKVEPKYKTEEQKELAKEFSQGYGMGFKMLEKMGFKVTKGLGKDEQGINRPVQAVFKTAFTMKDEPVSKQKKQKQSQEQQQQQKPKEIPIPQQLFLYKSKNKKIDNFLLNLKVKYQKLQSQIFHSKAQIDSFKKEEELSDNIRYQCEHEISDLNKQIDRLSNLSKNIYDGSKYPHLALKYKLDLLYVRECYSRVSKYSFEELCKYGENQLQKLVQVLKKLYQSKYKESLRQYEEKTGIQQKLNKKKDKKYPTSGVINVDDERKAQLGFEQSQKIQKYLELIIKRCFLSKLQEIFNQSRTIQKISNIKIIELLEMLKKYDKKGIIFAQFVKQNIVKRINQYLSELNLQSLQKQTKLLPHQVIFPWLTIINLQHIELMSLFHKVAGIIWNIDNDFLFNILSPWIKFAVKKQYNYMIYLYLGPRLLNLMESFDINQPNLQVLNGFIKYSQLLPFNLREEILENSLLLQVHEAYKQYKEKLEEKELSKWMWRWKKFVDKISPGFIQTYFKQYSIII